MKIKLLSNYIINQIAAGEIIEKPSSIVKELIENSLDAQSTKIDIILEESGKNLIIVSDNGIGMTSEELFIAVERHTTSKLNENDLSNIQTMGFRGEALPSIAAISKLNIISKSNNQESYQITINNNKKKISSTIYNVQGTKIEVKDIFYSTPARLKFLKTDRIELNSCIDIVKKLALANHHVHFSLINNNKIIIKTDVNSNSNNLKKRIIEILGEEFIQNTLPVNFFTDELSIKGYIGIPTYNRINTEYQYFFVNRRPIKDKYFHSALKIVYQDYLPKTRYPIAAIFLEINPYLIDVNVHPSKHEIRFFDPNKIKNLLIQSIQTTLEKSLNYKAVSQISYQKHKFIQANKTPLFDNNNDTNLQYTFNNKYNNKITNNVLHENTKCENKNNDEIEFLPLGEIKTHENTKCENKNNDEIEFLPLGEIKTQLFNTYIVSQTKNSLIIIDQHALHERLIYEDLKKNISYSHLAKQKLLIPIVIEFENQKDIDILLQNKNLLNELSLNIEHHTKNSIIIFEIPDLLNKVDIKKLIVDIADNLLEHSDAINLKESINYVLATYSCHYAIKAGHKLTLFEMNSLVRKMEKTPFSGQCNHGRPSYIELQLKDIEKLFLRR